MLNILNWISVNTKQTTDKKLKVGWILLGDINTGSSRIHGINIHRYFIQNGIESVIFQTNPVMTPKITMTKWEQWKLFSCGLDVLIFQKVFDNNAIALARKAKAQGIKTIFVICDLHHTDMITTVDKVVVTSEYLREFFHDKYKVDSVVIEDAIEEDVSIFKNHEDKEGLQLIWVGHQDGWQTLDVVKEALNQFPTEYFKLKTISRHPKAEVQWNLASITKEILTGDIAVIPAFDTEWARAKSNNRLVLFMGLGLPVIASPVPAYKRIIRNGYNGFIAENECDWKTSLLNLRSFEHRVRIGTQARNDVLPRYCIDTIGEQWKNLVLSR